MTTQPLRRKSIITVVATMVTTGFMLLWPVTTHAATTRPKADCEIKISSDVDLHEQSNLLSPVINRLHKDEVWSSPGCTVVQGGLHALQCGELESTSWRQITFDLKTRFMPTECGVITHF